MLKNNWIKSLIINTVIAAGIILLTYMSYETNDDYAISERLASGYPFIGYVNYYLSLGIVRIQEMLPSLNIYILFQLIASFVSFVIITKLILDRCSARVFTGVLILVLLVYSFDHYSLVQFTKTAAVMTVSSTMLLMDSIIEKRGPQYYALGIIMFYLAFMLRKESIVFPVLFAGMYLVIWLFDNRKRLTDDGYFKKKAIFTYVAVIILLAGSMGLEVASHAINEGTPPLKEYRDYNALRGTVVDYGVYKTGKDHLADYEKIGISANDLYMIEHWYLDYNGAASKENLAKIKETYLSITDTKTGNITSSAKSAARSIVKGLRRRSPTGIQVALLILIALLGLLTVKPSKWLLIFASGIATLAIHIALSYAERSVYRVLYIAEIEATFWLLYHIADSGIWYEFKDGSKAAKVMSVARTVVSCAIIAVSVLSLPGAYGRTVKKHEAAKLRPAEMAEQMESDSEHVYIFATSSKNYPSTYTDPVKAPARDSNVFSFGGWGTKSPYLLTRMEKYGLGDLFGDIIDNDKVYIVDNGDLEHIEEYFNKWYGEPQGKNIVLRKAGDLDGKDLWQVVTGEQR